MAENNSGSEQNDALAKAMLTLAVIQRCLVQQCMDSLNVKHRYIYWHTSNTCCCSSSKYCHCLSFAAIGVLLAWKLTV